MISTSYIQRGSEITSIILPLPNSSKGMFFLRTISGSWIGYYVTVELASLWPAMKMMTESSLDILSMDLE